MKVPLQWVWANDPEELPDDDHARCFDAPGERFIDFGTQRFAMTTRPCTCLSESRGGRITMSFSTLHMEYLGHDWPRCRAQKSWSGDPFDSAPLGGDGPPRRTRTACAPRPAPPHRRPRRRPPLAGLFENRGVPASSTSPRV